MAPMISSSHTLAAITAALLAVVPSSLAVPYISEFVASNQTGLTDEDGSLPDWIEIANPDGTAADLSGWSLTDDLLTPAKWVFPAGATIPAGGYLVVFASGKDRRVAGQNLHTNFSLSSGGEYLGLYAPSAATATWEYAPSYPVQTPDVSYGVLSSIPGSQGIFFSIPTPGAANNAASAVAESAAFSVPSKTFAQGSPFPLALSTPSGTATIRYTINRSMPINVDGVAPSVTVDPVTDIWTAVAHGLNNDDQVQVQATTMPGNIGLALNYYVKFLNSDTFTLAEDPGGPTVDVTSAGSVMHVRRQAAQWTQTSVGSILPVINHRFNTGDPVQVSSAGTLPAPLVPGTTYYVLNNLGFSTNLNNIQLSATLNGSAISLTSLGSGTHTIRRIPSTLYTGPITVDHSVRIRARTFQPGFIDGAPVSASYLMLDVAAQGFTSNIPVMVLHSFGSSHPSITASNPEDSKEDVWFVFEPKLEGTPPTTSLVARLTNPPDLVTPGYFERRGSSTFGAAKYSMTLGAYNELGDGGDVSPLGFASNDDFVLNAHFQFDRSLMHNDLIYRLSREAGRWAPQTRPVEVFMSVTNDVGASGSTPAYGIINGTTTGTDYYGVFSFQDKISRGQNRLDIEKLETTDNTAPNVQGGYIFKVDRLDIGDTGIGGAGRTFALVQPKEKTTLPAALPVATTQQKTYLSNTLNAMYNALIGATFMDPNTGYAAHLDVPAAIDHWWLSILPKSADAFRLSGYWHKSRFGKLAMGPIFDFDRAMGSTDGRDLLPTTWRGDTLDLGTNFFSSSSPGAGTAQFNPNYFERMFLDPNYWQATIDRYEELRKTVLSTAHVHDIINEWTELLDPGNGANTPAKRNGQKWVSSFNPYYRAASASTPGTNGTFRGESQWLKNWWGKADAVTANGRFDFVDGQFMRPPTGSLPDGPVPANSSVTLTSTSQSIPGAKIFYTTDGTDPRAPATAPQTLYNPGTPATVATLLQEVSSVRAIVPTADATGGTLAGNYEEWHGLDINANGNNADDFDDSSWFTNAAGTVNGVGYDDATAVDYLPYIRLRFNTATFSAVTVPTPTPAPISTISANSIMRSGTVNGTAYGGNQSAFIRWAFTVSAGDAALANTAGNSVKLQLRYDDGFVAWLNGAELTSARANAPNALATVPKYPYSAAATATHDDTASLSYVEYDITSFASSIHAGTNLLAIQGLNSGLGSSDFIIQPKLIVTAPANARPAYTPNLTTGATEFTTPLTITSPTKIVARTLHPLLASEPPTANGGGTGLLPNGSSWSAPTVLYYFPGAVSASQASIQITEVNYHPPTPTAAEIAAGFTNSNDFEFVRLTNVSATPVDLTGIYFSNGLAFQAAPGLQNWLPAGQSVVVVENLVAFQSRYGTSFTVLGQFSGELDDGGEHLVLNDKAGTVISDFIYGDSDPWPALADGDRSLVYVGGDQNSATSWRASVDPGGTAVINYAAWQARYFLPADIPSQTPSANTDSDNLSNLGEYAFVTDPRTPASSQAALATVLPGTPQKLEIRRRKGVTDITYVFEVATDLADWTAPGNPPSLVIDNGDGSETVHYDIPATTGTRQFLRVRVTMP